MGSFLFCIRWWFSLNISTNGIEINHNPGHFEIWPTSKKKINAHWKCVRTCFLCVLHLLWWKPSKSDKKRNQRKLCCRFVCGSFHSLTESNYKWNEWAHRIMKTIDLCVFLNCRFHHVKSLTSQTKLNCSIPKHSKHSKFIPELNERYIAKHCYCPPPMMSHPPIPHIAPPAD